MKIGHFILTLLLLYSIFNYFLLEDYHKVSQIDQIKDSLDKTFQINQFALEKSHFRYSILMSFKECEHLILKLKEYFIDFFFEIPLKLSQILEKSQNKIHFSQLNLSAINFANYFGGAIILANSAQLKGVENILTDNFESYMITECSETTSYFIISLKEEIQMEKLAFINKEFYTSTMKKFQIYGSVVYPTDEWNYITKLDAIDSNEWQIFEIEEQFLRYLKIEIIEFYQSEYHCAITQIRVFGQTVVADLIDSHKRYKVQPLKQENNLQKNNNFTIQIKNENQSNNQSTNNLQMEEHTCSVMDYFYFRPLSYSREYINVLPFETNQSLFKVTTQNIVILSHNIDVLKDNLRTQQSDTLKKQQEQKLQQKLQQQLLDELEQQKLINSNLENQIQQIQYLSFICFIALGILGIAIFILGIYSNVNINNNKSTNSINGSVTPDLVNKKGLHYVGTIQKSKKSKNS